MWIFTKFGFFSIVRANTPARPFHVRARAKQDLVALSKSFPCKIRPRVLKSFPGSDYPFRMIVDWEQFLFITETLAESVDYANFKSAMAGTPAQANKLPALHSIWTAMRAWQGSIETDYLTPKSPK